MVEVDYNHLLSMYADDALIYLTKPTTILYLKNLIFTYGYFSDYTFYVDKTIAMDIGANISDTVNSRWH